MWVAAIALAACMPDTAGVPPASDRIFYPTAASITPDGGYLAVANSNFDLAYRAGTVVVVDISKVADELVPGCPEEGCDPVEEAEFLLAGETVRTGSYASTLEKAPGGTRMYLTVRGDTTLTTLDFDPAAETGKRLTCFNPDDPPRSRECSSDHRVKDGLSADPYAIGIRRITYALDGGDVTVDWIFVSHLTSGKITVFEAEVNPLERDLAPRAVLEDSSFPEGVSAIEYHPLVPSSFYTATRHADVLYTFGFASDPQDFDGSTRIVLGPTVGLDAVGDGHDNRDLAFSGDGTMAYVTNRTPNSLIMIDTSLDEFGYPRNDAVGAVELDSGPSLVTVWSPPGSGREWVYASCYNSDRVYVIDPEIRAAVDVILTGNGPHTFVADGEHMLGYLLNFLESTISVVDLDPSSATFNDVRATLGIPEKVRSND